MKTTIFRQLFTVFFILTITIFYFSCGFDVIPNPKTTQTPISCVSGQISGWTYGGKKTLKFLVYSVTHHIYPVASTLIDAQGNFNICLPSTLSDTTLFPADSVFYSSCPGIGVSNPPDSKGAQILRMYVYNGDTLFGSIKKCNFITVASGSFEAMYIYVNKDMSASGTKYCNGDTLQFNGTAVKGWNEITKNYISVSSSGNIILFNNTEPSGPYWRLTVF